MSENGIRNYYLVFHKDCENVGRFVFAVGEEDVALQFCKDFKDYYYVAREMLVEDTEVK